MRPPTCPATLAPNRAVRIARHDECRQHEAEAHHHRRHRFGTRRCRTSTICKSAAARAAARSLQGTWRRPAAVASGYKMLSAAPMAVVDVDAEAPPPLPPPPTRRRLSFQPHPCSSALAATLKGEDFTTTVHPARRRRLRRLRRPRRASAAQICQDELCAQLATAGPPRPMRRSPTPSGRWMRASAPPATRRARRRRSCSSTAGTCRASSTCAASSPTSATRRLRVDMRSPVAAARRSPRGSTHRRRRGQPAEADGARARPAESDARRRRRQLRDASSVESTYLPT